MMINLSLQINNKINFKQVEIEDLTTNNTLFVDQLDNQTFNDVAIAIKSRATEVINDKMMEQGLKTVSDDNEISPINADTNGDSFVPEQNSVQTQVEPSVTDTAGINEAKEQAKNKLINAIATAMGEAQTEGRAYTLVDLITLEVPGSAVSVAIDGNVANVNIDGFEFKINSDFQLYE